MKTQILKLEPLRVNIKSVFDKIANKFARKNSQITVIIKSSEEQMENNFTQSRINTSYKASSSIQDTSKQNNQKRVTNSQINQKTKKNLNSQFIISEQPNEEQISVQICISNHDIMPNVTISGYNKRQKTVEGLKRRRVSLDNMNFPLWHQNNILDKLKQSCDQMGIQKRKNNHTVSFKKVQKVQEPEKVINENQSESTSSINTPTQSKQELIKKIKNQSQSDIVQGYQSDEQSLVQSLFVIQSKLNDAIKFIRNNQIFQLEEYLYQFKTKYKNLSERIQIKWRLLMAHCKESRKQYERASILYQQVLQLSYSSSKALSIDTADINHRLGICYTQIRKWNEGIMAFVKAINQLKSKGKIVKYAQCMNNLGTLYLSAGKIQQAEKCFLASYRIKKQQLPPGSKNLISTLLNLFQCNLCAHNYLQASQVLTCVESCSSQIKGNEMILGAIERRKGKLSFLKGNISEANIYYQKAYNRLSQKYPYCLQLGQLMNNIGIVKIQQQQLNEAKRFFDQAIIILNLYYTKDSICTQTIKKNLQLVNSLIKKGKTMNLTLLGEGTNQQFNIMEIFNGQNLRY